MCLKVHPIRDWSPARRGYLQIVRRTGIIAILPEKPSGSINMIRIGIIGIGFMGMIHYLAARQLTGGRVVALCSRDSRKLAGDWTSIQGNFGPRGTHGWLVKPIATRAGRGSTCSSKSRSSSSRSVRRLFDCQVPTATTSRRT